MLDRHDKMPIDIARRIDHAHRDQGPSPAPTVAYGRYIGALCRGCHGPHLTGGRLPGAPPSMAVPLNLTPHESGLAGVTYDDFVEEMRSRRAHDGHRLDPMMPTEAIVNMDETERRALWAYLQSMPPRPFGGR